MPVRFPWRRTREWGGLVQQHLVPPDRHIPRGVCSGQQCPTQLFGEHILQLAFCTREAGTREIPPYQH